MAVPVAQETPGAARVRSLDGLRGVAAVVVVLHHCLLVEPALAAAYHAEEVGGLGGAATALSLTPLHLFWAGGEAVLVFFVLSGLVLALPHAHRSVRAAWWTSYYPRRLVRLYLPVWAALVLAAFTMVVVDRSPAATGSSWLNGHPALTSTGLGSIASDALLFPSPGNLNSVLWSLKWEVAFSLLLPLYVALGRRTRRVAPWLLVALLLAVVGAGALGGGQAMVYLPIFAIGTVLAFQADLVRRHTARWRDRHWIGFATLSVALLLSYWLVLLVPAARRAFEQGRPVLRLTAVLTAAGAAGVVVVAWHWRPAVAAFEHRIVQWLGSRSFSHYLVHEPIIVAIGFAAGGFRLALVPVGVGLSLVVAEGFYRVAEHPSIGLSRRVGRWAAAATGDRVDTRAG